MSHQVSALEQQKGHLQCQTHITLLFSLFFTFLPQVDILIANSLGDTKKTRQRTKPTFNPLQLSSEVHTKESKKILVKLLRLRLALKFTSL